MESRGIGRRTESENNGEHVSIGRRTLRQPGMFLRALTGWLLCGTLLWFGLAQAQTSYVHDANGRVVAVTQSNGTTVQYTYDALGHPGQVSAPLPVGQLAIFAFTPTHGAAGTLVTLDGQGFSSSVANDNVSFTGTVAAVLSASATQLVVAVPAGATTGPISTTVGGQTAVSATPFVIDDTGARPTILQVTPVVAVGSTVTVTGMHLDPITGDTAVQMGGLDMLLVSSLTDNQLQYTVPNNAVSGHVAVDTPYGTAISATPVAVLPSSIVSEANGAPTGYLATNGNAINFGGGAAGQIGILTFDAHQGDNLEFELSNVTTAGGVQVQLYSPSGVEVESFACNANAGPSCDQYFWNLAAGTYSMVVVPSGSGTLGFTAQLQSDVIGPALTAGTPVAVNMGMGQVERFTFSATAGQTVSLELSGLSTTPAGQSIHAVVFAPGTITTTNYLTVLTTSGSGVLNLTNLPASGTYTVVVDTGGIGFPVTAQLTLLPGAGGTVTDNGVSQSYSATIAGQNGYLSFTANAGDNLELELSDVIAASTVEVQIYNPSGTQVASYICGATTGPSCDLLLWNLAAGMYSAVVVPAGSGMFGFTAQLQPDVIGPTLTPGTPATVNLGMGQVERFTFSVIAGQTIALNLAGVSTTPSGRILNVGVYAPGAVTPNNYYSLLTTSSSGTLNLPNLPASGTYTVVVDTNGIGLPATAQLTLLPAVTGSVTSNGASQSYSATTPGQNVYLSFTANAGDNLELELSDVTAGGVEVQIYNPSGTQVTSYTCGATLGPSCDQYLFNLVAGTYSVVVVSGGTGTLGFTAQLQPDVIGPALTPGVPATVNLGMGQVERFSFSATAGQTVALGLSGVSTTPSGQSLYVVVFVPGTVTTTNYYGFFITSSSGSLNLPSLPSSGTYTVIVDTGGIGFPATAQLILTTP